ncbi:3-methyl-2-oxobutanoate hydroxymethyltransferase [Metallumcola ferriviriculae]|uniref:3-methyl-2-oxobutanoate hydroxymethyltransferase n=1 Tax=Metallumcola ferriviriculae TaxID=3039180 RepID=A0AAU0UK23_9FIRM|nr:3-methyl-2-oxobutanoate hydroxymethyltransferase [Desulfitibacteraceae bacterium MK1]
MTKKVTINILRQMKAGKEKITMLTAYDYPTALLVDRAGIDMILVGDSLGMTVLGLEDTVPVTMEDMIHHTRAVTRAVSRCFVVADMPFMSYNISREEAIRNAGRLVKEAGAHAVKLEGGVEMAPVVKAIVDAGIPVLGHLGLTPQTATKLGGFKVQGRSDTAADKMLSDARALQEAGVFGIVLECVPVTLADMVTSSAQVPTIGIGAGPGCDGQVLVYHDLLGLFDRFQPRFVKRYRDLSQEITEALTEYKEEVQTGSFPAEEHTFK